MTLLYDVTLRRPACVLLQAASGCDYAALGRLGFPSRTWLVNSTPGMRRIEGTEEEWRAVAKMAPRGEVEP